jgi:hypothetical protein
VDLCCARCGEAVVCDRQRVGVAGTTNGVESVVQLAGLRLLHEG